MQLEPKETDWNIITMKLNALKYKTTTTSEHIEEMLFYVPLVDSWHAPCVANKNNKQPPTKNDTVTAYIIPLRKLYPQD